MSAIAGWMMAASGALAACGSDGGSPGEGPPTTITITIMVQTLDGVAFRNDTDSTWQAATLVAPNQYSIVVTGPYWVSVACHFYDHPDELIHAFSQYGRTLSDPTELDDGSCGAIYTTTAAPSLLVTGTLAQEAKVALGTTPASYTGNRSFQLDIDPGTYTLYAASADHYLAQHDLEITASGALPIIDVDATGVLMTTTPFAITNPAKGTGLVPQAAVLIEDFAKYGDQPGLYTYLGDPATTQIVPASALAIGELQTVSIREITTLPQGQSGRAYRRPFKAGDSTQLTLPDPIDGLTWSTDQGQFSAHWNSLPADMPFSFLVSGQSVSGDAFSSYTIDLSPSFLRITGTTRIAVETNLPGFDPSWNIDPTAGYSLDTSGQIGGNASTDPVISVWDNETNVILD